MDDDKTKRHWYAIYTRSHAEKKLSQRLNERGFDTFLPLSASTRNWSDRTKIIHEPLFKSYLFVCSDIHGLHLVKTLPGFAYFLRFGGYPVTIPQQQINRIRTVLKACESTTSIASHYVKGDKVTVIKGPLKEMSGILTEIKGKQQVAIEVSQLNQSMLVSLPPTWIIKTEELR
ncbi:Transcription antitermination protein RfaH [Vibrio aerogenes CECT 7868]|uniref:Transcription antitermination protein RfaH n=1 Tax=Vibrio aerogenes CECT 7868 TaxID=1216006 RepID=A0A1M5Z6G9_9VIBR|nr:UpxY family transcription antiterminator [Vibrio aerogenes]SHI19857.1 Transcription antitermination protein RfaH [Vibrio aerogenes CECT 7868]